MGDVVGAFKSITTHAYIQGVEQRGWPGFRGRVWRKHGYPPDKQEKATQTVLEQAEVLCEEWVMSQAAAS